MNTKQSVAVQSGDGKIGSLVQQVTEIKMDIRKLQGDAANCEHEIIRQLVREKRTECLSINYGALRRFYHD